MKQHTKKKKYQAHCREMVVSKGRVNDEQGNWIPANTLSGSARRMHECMLAGYRVK